MEYGIFNEEGLVEGGFFSLEAAHAAMVRYPDGEYAGAICWDHEDQPAEFCEECSEDE